jgi:hypothetical protein
MIKSYVTKDIYRKCQTGLNTSSSACRMQVQITSILSIFLTLKTLRNPLDSRVLLYGNNGSICRLTMLYQMQRLHSSERNMIMYGELEETEK